MATKAKKSTTKKAAPAEAASTVTRIKASEPKAKKVTKTTTEAKVTKQKSRKKSPLMAVFRPFIASGAYFKGAWFELRQVRWPNRKETWGLTAAVLVFSVFFILLILLLDVLFKYLFELILK